MKILKYIIIIWIVGGFMSCSDDSLDPLRFSEVEQSPMLGLRSYSFDRLGMEEFITGVDTFNVLQDNSNEAFTYVVDFVAEDPSDMESVEVFVVTKSGDRAQVATVPASAFEPGAEGTNFNRAEISVPFTDIFSASGFELCDFQPSSTGLGEIDFLEIQSDIVLSDGTRVRSDAAVNSNLFESEIFYPAHNLRYVAVGPVIENQQITINSGEMIEVMFDSLVTRGVPGIEYSWVAAENPNVSGATLEGTGNAITDVLTVDGDRRQAIAYDVTSQMPNGCAGTPFTVTVVIRPNE